MAFRSKKISSLPSKESDDSSAFSESEGQEEGRVEEKPEEEKDPIEKKSKKDQQENPQEADEETHEVLKKIFHHDHKENDMKKMQKKKSHRASWFVGFLLVFCFSVAGVLAKEYWPKVREEKTETPSLKIEWEMAEEVASGEDVSMTIMLLNQDRVALNDVVFVLRAPSGFTLTESSVPPKEKELLWDVGRLSKGGSYEVTVSGTVIGKVGSEKNFSGIATFVPENFRSQFEVKAEKKLVVNSSLLEINTTASTLALADVPYSVSLELTNRSDQTLSGVRLHVDTPLDFSLQSTKPKTTNQSWVIEKLEPEEKFPVELSGVFSGGIGESREIVFTASVEDSSGEDQLQAQKTLKVDVTDVTSTVELSSTQSEAGGELGKVATYHIRMANTSTITLKNVSMDVVYADEQELIDHEAFAQEHPDWPVRENWILTLNSTTHPILSEIAPGDSAEFDWEIPIIENVPPDAAHRKLNLTAVAKLAAFALEDGSIVATKSSESKALTIKFSSTATVQSQSRYYSDTGESWGSGPLPPMVGKQTFYRILWKVTTNANDVDQLTVSAKIPDSVFWVGRTSVNAGKAVTFDVDSRTVTWRIDQAPAFSGSFNPRLEASFDVAVTPITNDVGSALTLVEDTTLSGKDHETGKVLQDVSEDQSTVLSQDPVYQGDGRVVAEEE